MRSLWDLILQKLENRIASENIDEWLLPTKLIQESDSELTIHVPNELFIPWIQENYLEEIYLVLEELGKKDTTVNFTSQDFSQEEKSESKFIENGVNGTDSLKLNSKYSFDSFVVGKSNQFPHAAARAVAESPSSSYNPLYIYGYSGLGKTHLLQAIAAHLADAKPYLKLCYTTCEEFTNQFINSIRYNRGEAFRERYRSVDVLIIDDIQFLSGKMQTQEEFFHTFNSLFEQQKQIILSSDCAPSAIQKLESRLTSRFQWGLIADIQPPELETRIAILKKKAESERIYLRDDVLLYIANKVKTNVRELEGALVKLIAYASLGNKTINMDLAEQCLRSFIKHEPSEISCERIQKLVADRFKLLPKDLCSKSNTKKIAKPRQIAMYLTRQLTNMSLPEIGAAFGNKHHSTVLYSVQKIEKLIDTDQEEGMMIRGLEKSLA